MVTVRRVAALVTIANSLWTVLAAGSSLSLLALPTGNLQIVSWWGDVILIFGVLLFLDGVACILELGRGFIVGALLSGIILASFLATQDALGNATPLIAMVLGLIAVILDLLAARPRRRISEQTHPMNLPVFG